MFWLFLIGVAVGVGFTLIGIFGNYKVEKREWWEEWEEWERSSMATHACLRKAVAENAKLRVALAAAEVTEDAKKVVAMTMAALDTDIAVEKTT